MLLMVLCSTLPSVLSLHTFLGDLNHLYSFNFTYVPKHHSPTLATLLTSCKIFIMLLDRTFIETSNSTCSVWTIYPNILICQEFKLCPLPNNSQDLSILSHKYVLNMSLPLTLHHSPLALVLDNYDALKFIFLGFSIHSPPYACLSPTRKNPKSLA